MDVEDQTIREATSLALVFAFVLNHFMSIVFALAAIFLCSVFASIFELLLSPLKAFALSAVCTVAGCAVLFFISAHRQIRNQHKDDSAS